MNLSGCGDKDVAQVAAKVKSVGKLLSGEEQIELNGEVIPLTPNSQQKLITKQQVKLIEDKSES